MLQQDRLLGCTLQAVSTTKLLGAAPAMPRILRILNRLNLGGPTYNAAYLTRYVPSPFETLLVAGRPEPHEIGSDYILESLSLKARRIPSMRRAIHPVADVRAYMALSRLIREYKPDIVHTHASKAGTLGRLAAKAHGVPIILHTFHGHWFHSYFSPLKTRVLLEVERKLSRISTAVVAISPDQARDLTETYHVAPREKVRIVPLGIQVERFQTDREARKASFRERFHIPEDNVLLMHVGRLVPIKQQDLLLKVFARLRETAKVPVTLCIVGGGPELESLKALARSLSLPYRLGDEPGSQPLVFTSWLTGIEEVHAAADIGILTSKNEGTPLSLIECQAAGRPVLSTDVGGVRDIVIPGETGFLSRPGDLESLAKNALHLIEDHDLRTAMGKKAEAFAAERFSHRRLVEDMTKLYTELWEAHLTLIRQG